MSDIDPHAIEPGDGELGAACALWQSGRDSGSSPLRAAARVLTGTPHYFDSDFIRTFEDIARHDAALRQHAAVLLNRLSNSPMRTAQDWGRVVGVDSSWAGRGTPGGEHADQIRAALSTGRLSMPLWGVSLSIDVAAGFGDRFTFEITGAFPAIIASHHSGIKQDELELITGGEYVVDSPVETEAGGVLARLSFVGIPDATLIP